MREVQAIYHRTKETNIYPLEGNRYLIESFLQDEIHDVHVEVEVVHPSLEIIAARSQVRNGPFTSVCDRTHPNIEGLVGMTVGRGFTMQARAVVGGAGGCHRVSELVVEVAQAAYQLHFVVHFSKIPQQERVRDDVPIRRWRSVNDTIPGMRNTCFSYNDENEALIESDADPLRLRDQTLPTRQI